jgi:5-methylcytosine-specific restriction protein A
MISANSSMYDHTSLFEHNGFIDWRQGNGKFQVNDIVYIYCTRPLKKIQYKCRIEKVDGNELEMEELKLIIRN